MAEKRLPPDGSEVVAMTIESIEHNRPAREVRGRLATRWVPRLGGYTQCWVDGVQVDGDTVRLAKECDPPRSIRTLIRALKHEDEIERLCAAMDLWERGPEAKSAARALIRTLGDADDAVAAAAAIALTKVDPAAATAAAKTAVLVLIRALKYVRPLEEDEDADEGAHASIEALGNIGPAAQDAIPALKSLVFRGDKKARQLAEEALQKIQNHILPK